MAGVTKETFQGADVETKMDMLFDYHLDTLESINEILDMLKQHPVDCDTRFKAFENKTFGDPAVCNNRFIKLEKKKRFDTALSTIMGIIGGAAAVFAAIMAKIKL